MLSRTKSALCMALALSILAISRPTTWAQEIHWAPDIAAARRASIEYKVPVLIHFYGDNCLPCKLLEQNVLNRTEVVDTLNKYFICVKINASQERSTAAQYGVHSWPTDVFISPDGKTLDQGTCKQTPAAYLSVLHGIAVMNRDRNVMFAAEQTDRADQVTSQVANYAQPATAAPAGLPAAGQVAPANPQGPNFYSQGAGSAMQQLPNSLAPGTAVASGPLLSQNQPHPITTAVQAAGNQIAPAAGPRELNTSDGHLPPMEFAGQISGTQSGRGTDPLAAVVATTAPTVPAPQRLQRKRSMRGTSHNQLPQQVTRDKPSTTHTSTLLQPLNKSLRDRQGRLHRVIPKWLACNRSLLPCPTWPIRTHRTRQLRPYPMSRLPSLPPALPKSLPAQCPSSLATR
ncbi:MAG: thioredoxin family protein [Pirellulaceae bacterium]